LNPAGAIVQLKQHAKFIGLKNINYLKIINRLEILKLDLDG
jgi:hypothetical protein